MTYAIIETGGKQLRVEPGRFYDIELLSSQPDETVTIESVLLVQHNGEVTIGQPLVAGATVEGTVLRHLRGRKVIVYKMKPKKKTRKKRGHRQEITRLLINSISIDGTVLTAEQATSADESQASAVSVDVDYSSTESTEPVTSADESEANTVTIDVEPVTETAE
jgi:large subunit ribosomal protein L21